MTATFACMVKGKATPIWLFIGLGVLFLINVIVGMVRTIKTAKLHTKA